MKRRGEVRIGEGLVVWGRNGGREAGETRGRDLNIILTGI